MYFKGMQLQGFKSFADKTTLDFKGGVTAVVGPNGSGKSNISDAIRWVMGETSAKSLRGAKMEDVIFCGSEKRKPMGFAEVTIIMDNSDHSMHIDFEEVSVTRRVYRSGESEYMINKAPCRLKDIHELFMDTGLGKDGYSIIGQGKIDAILSAKSEERRHIFDEAAGITKFRYRKNEAEKKLAAAEENLLRVGDIITELEGQVEPLRVQSEKAREYLKLRDQQKELEVSLWLRRIDESKKALEEVTEKHRIVREHIASVEEKIANTEAEITACKEKQKQTEGEMDKARAEMYARRDAATRSAGDIEVLQASILHNSENILRLEGELNGQKERQQELAGLLVKRREELEALEGQRGQWEEKISACGKLLWETAQKLAGLQKKNAESGGEIAELNQNLSRCGEKAAANRQLLLSMDGREEELRELVKLRQDKTEGMQSQVDELKQQTGRMERQAEKARGLAEECQHKLEASEKAYAAQKNRILTAENEFKTLSNRKKILEDLENSFEGYSKSIQSVMNEKRFGSLKNASIFGPVSALIKTESRYVTAVEAAVGGAMNHIVTAEEEDAKKAIQYLKNNRKGRVTFLPVCSVKGKLLRQEGVEREAGYIGLGCELVQTDAKFRGIIESLLGRTVIVDTMDHAVSMARKYRYSFKIATLQGEILNAGGSITGGSMNTASGGLSRRSEIKAITAKLAEMEADLDGASPRLDNMKRETDKARGMLSEAQQAYWESRRVLTEALTSSRHVFQAYENLKSELENAQNDLERLLSEKQQAKLLEAALTQQQDRLKQSLQSLSSGQSETIEEISRLQNLHAESLQKKNEMLIEQNNIVKDIDVLTARLAEETQEAARLEQTQTEKIAEKDRLSDENKTHEREIEEKRKQSARFETDVTDFERRIKELEQTRAVQEQQQEKAENALKDLNADAFKLQGEEGRVEARRVKLESESETILSRLWDDYELTYTEAAELRTRIEDVPAAEKLLNSVKAKIKALGNINLNAIEDYKAVKERYEFLTEQRADIQRAKAELEQLIEEMVSVMTEMFEQNFARLSEKFSETFRDLFGGGSASLKLSEPDDVLSSGVEIEVQPPGKNLQSITLLSGGEKAFTAIALIFSILKINPTHFCIFDEIEAALDDVNVFRFADFLRSLSKRTQFIVITHRKGTMEAADTLYGVTMQEKGVTSLLSLALDKI